MEETARAGGDRHAERFVRVRLRTIADGAGLLLDPDAGKLVAVDRRVSEVLATLTGCHTLEAHAENYLNKLIRAQPVSAQPSPQDRAALIEALQRLAAVGLLTPESDWLCRVEAAAGRLPAGSIGRVAVVTKDRPAYVRRSLETIRGAIASTARKCTVCVYDDSEGGETEGVVGEARAAAGVAVAYAGRRQKQERLRLIEAFGEVPPDVLRFALCPEPSGLPPYGANLNWLLVDTANEMVFCADDDVLCDPWLYEEPVPGLAVTSAQDPTRIRIFPSREAAFGALRKYPGDIFALHERVLGRTVADCIAASGVGGLLDLGGISGHFAGELASGGGSVAATISGLAGDSGTSQPWLALSGDSLDWLDARTPAADTPIDSREVIRAVDRLTIAESPRFMNFACGLDNRSLLPPFLPVGRNMDGVFAMTLRRCLPRRYFGYLPWVVRHDAPPRGPLPRGFDPPRLSDLLNAVIASCPIEPNCHDEAANLRLLGRHLAHVGSLPPEEFAPYLRFYFCSVIAARLRRLESTMGEGGGEAWFRHCHEQQARFHELLADLSDVSASDLRSAGDPLEQTRRRFRQFGELLIWWPDLAALAARTREVHGPIGSMV